MRQQGNGYMSERQRNVRDEEKRRRNTRPLAGDVEVRVKLAKPQARNRCINYLPYTARIKNNS